MLPVKKRSKSRTRTKRAHHALQPTHYSLCPKCSSAKLPHAACGNCGYLNAQITLNLGKEATT
ncbi:MAG: 50S ribosomal protein L32 [Phycisphaerae bacterium]|nr:50S ribosomal protein L32 [Phycisphaerae bacterium]